MAGMPPLDPVKAALVGEAMRLLSAGLAQVTAVSGTSIDVLDEFPIDRAFFEMVQKRAATLEAEVAALRRRQGRDAQQANLAELLGQVKKEFQAAGGPNPQAPAVEQERTDLVSELDDLSPKLVVFVASLPA